MQQCQFCFLYFEHQNEYNLLNEIFYLWKAVTLLYVKSIRCFLYVMQWSHCVLSFLTGLYVLFMGYTYTSFGFVLLPFGYTVRRFSFVLCWFHNVLLLCDNKLFLFGYWLFIFAYGFFKYTLFIWLCVHLV